LVEVSELAHSLLFTDDIHVIRPIHFLQSLDGKSRKEANDRNQKEASPKGCLSVDLGGGSIEVYRRGERCVDSGPKEN
jgi:hypothetical protein